MAEFLRSRGLRPNIASLVAAASAARISMAASPSPQNRARLDLRLVIVSGMLIGSEAVLWLCATTALALLLCGLRL